MPHKSPLVSPAPQPSVAVWKRIPGWLYAAVCFLALVISLLGGYPWLSIQRDDSFSTTNPYGTAFSIANDGYIPVADLEAVCYQEFGNNAHTFGSFDNDLRYPHFAQSLWHSDRATLPCFRLQNFLSGPGVSQMLKASQVVNLTIFVNYAFMGFNAKILRRTQSFKFRAVAAEDGSWHWIFVH